MLPRGPSPPLAALQRALHLQPVPAAAALDRQTPQPGARPPLAAPQRALRPWVVPAAAALARRTPQPGAKPPLAALQQARCPRAASAAASRACLRQGAGLKAERGGRCSRISSSGRRRQFPPLPPQRPQTSLPQHERPVSPGLSSSSRRHPLLGRLNHSRQRMCRCQLTAGSWPAPGRQRRSRSCLLAAVALRPSLPPEQQPSLQSSTCQRCATRSSDGKPTQTLKHGYCVPSTHQGRDHGKPAADEVSQTGGLSILICLPQVAANHPSPSGSREASDNSRAAASDARCCNTSSTYICVCLASPVRQQHPAHAGLELEL